MVPKNARVGNPTIEEISPDRRKAVTLLSEIKKTNKNKKFVKLLKPGVPVTVVEVEVTKYESNPDRYAGFKVIKER